MNVHRVAIGISEILKIRDTFSDPILVANFTTPLIEKVVSELDDEPNPYLAAAGPIQEQFGNKGLDVLNYAIKYAKKHGGDTNGGKS